MIEVISYKESSNIYPIYVGTIYKVLWEVLKNNFRKQKCKIIIHSKDFTEK